MREIWPVFLLVASTGVMGQSGFTPEAYLDFDFTVADVHTQPTEPGGAVVGNVLHVGNDKINLAVVIAPNSADANGKIC